MASAWDLIGHDGSVRIAGGHTIYESVEFNGGEKVRLSRIVVGDSAEIPLRVITRYVDPDTELEVLS